MTDDVFRTLCAIDFSPSSLAALDFAITLAAPEQAPAIHVVHALAMPIVPLPAGDTLLAPDFHERVRSELEKSLHDVVAPRRGPVPIETHLVTGSPPAALVDHARALGCKRIAVGATGRGLLPRFLLGSITERIVRTSPVEVLVVPTPEKGTKLPSTVRNIVCAIDFAPAGASALLRALDLAHKHGARLHLVHAWHVAPYVERMPELAASIERDMMRELDATAQRHARPGLTILRHLRRGAPAIEIVQAAREHEADLVVIGTTSKSGLDRVLLGSVAERVVRTSHVPVLVALPGATH